MDAITLGDDNRVFLALEPPEATRARLAALARAQAEAWGGRPVPSENLHLTLCFLGRIDPQRLPAVVAASREVGEHAVGVRARVTGIGAKPQPRHARLLAAELADEHGLVEVCALAAGVVPVAAGQQPDTRPPWPHITLVRLRSPRAVRPDVFNDEHVFVFDRLTLYDSRTGHGGPSRYVPVVSVHLEPIQSP